MRLIFRWFLLLLLVLAMAMPAIAAQPRQDVATALDEMHAWVGDGPAGLRWREFLRSAELEEQLARGPQADPARLKEVLRQYRSGAAGLDRPRFVAVQTALEAWIQELTFPKPEELPEFARASKAHYTPLTEADAAQARAGLQRAMYELEAFLRPGSAGSRGWKSYLGWDQLQAQLLHDAEPDRQVLVDVYRRFVADNDGLELPAFLGVANALRNYIEVLAMTSISNGREQHESQLDALAESLERFGRQPLDEDEHFNIGRRLGQLAVSRQAGSLVNAVRAYFSQPNLFVEASAPLVAAGIARPVDRTTPVTDNILGTSIRGTGHLRGDVRVQLVPNDERATIDTLLFGDIASNTVGQNGPVTIYSTGQTKVAARKRLLMDETGFNSLPARANAVTNNTVNNIAGGGMATRVAWDRVAQNRDQANRLAADSAARRVIARMDQEAGEMLGNANSGFASRIRHPLLRLDAYPELFQFQTTDDSLLVTVLRAGRFHLAAPTPPPQLNGQHDLSLRVHQSLANNLAAALLANRTLDDEAMRARVLMFSDELPEELKEGEEEEPWTITFDRLKPISLVLDDGGLVVTIRGQRYTSGDRTFQAMNIRAAYKMEIDGEGLRLTRQGDVEILPPGFVEDQDTLSASQLTLKRILERKFNRIFKPEIVTEGLELPGNWKRAGKLRPVELSSKDGWLTLGWTMPAETQVSLVPTQPAGSWGLR